MPTLIQCRGKNGWFTLKRIVVRHLTITPSQCSIEFESKVFPDLPPIIFEGNVTDLRKVFTTVLEFLNRTGEGSYELHLETKEPKR